MSAGPHPSAESDCGKRGPARVLVIDDDPQVLSLFDEFLTAGGLSVNTAESGRKGISILGRQPVDLVILDLSMPDADGFEVLAILRSTYPDLKIIVTSGLGAHGVLLKAALLLGATAALAKPTAAARLLETVQHVLAQ